MLQQNLTSFCIKFQYCCKHERHLNCNYLLFFILFINRHNNILEPLRILTVAYKNFPYYCKLLKLIYFYFLLLFCKSPNFFHNIPMIFEFILCNNEHFLNYNKLLLHLNYLFQLFLQ